MVFNPRASDRVPMGRRGVDGLMSKPMRSSSPPQRGVRRCNSLDEVLLGCSSHSTRPMAADDIFGETEDESSSVASSGDTYNEDNMIKAGSPLKKGDAAPQPPSRSRGNRPVVLRCNSLDNVLMEGSAHSIGKHKLSVEDIFGPSDDEVDDADVDNSSISSKSALDFMVKILKPRQRCNSMDDMLKEGSSHSVGTNLDANYIFSDQDDGDEFGEESSHNEESPQAQAFPSDQAPKQVKRRVSNPGLVGLEGLDAESLEDQEEVVPKPSRDRCGPSRHNKDKATICAKQGDENAPILKPRARAKLIPQAESPAGVLKRTEDHLSTNTGISRQTKTPPSDQPPKMASRSEPTNGLYKDDEQDEDNEVLWADRAPKLAMRTSSRPSLYGSDSDEENHVEEATVPKGLPPLPPPKLSRPPVFGDAPPKLARRQRSNHDIL